MPKRGPFIVIEGSDGSGKTEQVECLVNHLKREGFVFAEFAFPQYDDPSAYLLKKYLAGDFGSIEEVSPTKASVCFAVNRLAAAKEMSAARTGCDIIISNRYSASNFAHQGAKIEDDDKRRIFFEWLYQFEFGILELPKPDVNIVLHVPPRISTKLIEERNVAKYADRNVPRDIHEENPAYLARVVAAYLELFRFFPNDFRLIECVEHDRLLSIEEIHEKVWLIVKDFLPH